LQTPRFWDQLKCRPICLKSWSYVKYSKSFTCIMDNIWIWMRQHRDNEDSGWNKRRLGRCVLGIRGQFLNPLRSASGDQAIARPISFGIVCFVPFLLLKTFSLRCFFNYTTMIVFSFHLTSSRAGDRLQPGHIPNRVMNIYSHIERWACLKSARGS
jgi:hypothetical protein